MIKAIFFLGNPGKRYETTRHNAAWMLCDRLIRTYHLTEEWKNKFHAVYREAFNLATGKIILCRPQTYMNKSGISVRELSRFYRLSGEEILVIHDDLETSYGTLTMQFSGGHGGHNGVRSVVTEFGTKDFYRLKIGIGRPARGSVSSYVLSRFSPDEDISLDRVLKEAEEFLVSKVLSSLPSKTKSRIPFSL